MERSSSNQTPNRSVNSVTNIDAFCTLPHRGRAHTVGNGMCVCVRERVKVLTTFLLLRLIMQASIVHTIKDSVSIIMSFYIALSLKAKAAVPSNRS